MCVQEGNGELVDSWRLVSASEERLLLHQFLRFDETRAMAQHLIIQHALQQLIAHHHSAAHLRPTSLHPAAAAAAVVHDSRHHQGDLRSLTQSASATSRHAGPGYDGEEQPRSGVSGRAPAGDAAAETGDDATASYSAVSTAESRDSLDPSQTFCAVARRRSRDLYRLYTPHIDNDDDTSLRQTAAAKCLSDVQQQSDQLAAAGQLGPGVLHARCEQLSGVSGLGGPGVVRRPWQSTTPGYGGTLVSPTTGKKRVLCAVCRKTFCDKGALKIHYSAVHQ